AVDAYHHGNWERPTAAVRANFRIMRLDQCFQLRPRHHRRHLGQKHVALRALLLPCKVQRRKAQLRIHPVPSESRAQCAMLHAVVQGFLKSKSLRIGKPACHWNEVLKKPFLTFPNNFTKVEWKVEIHTYLKLDELNVRVRERVPNLARQNLGDLAP